MSIRDAAMYLNSLLRESDHGYEDCLSLLRSNYCESHRHYHNWDHIDNLFRIYKKMGVQMNDSLFLSTLFHDIIWNPLEAKGEYSNESRSAKLFKDYVGNNLPQNLIDEVVGAILDTHHTEEPKTKTGKILCEADLHELVYGDLDVLLKNEKLIFKEYQMYRDDQYLFGRLQFLSKWEEKNGNIKHLISYLKQRKINVGIYPGSFNPFHVGHLNILLKAEALFDKVIIARGVNHSKSKNDVATMPNSVINYRRYITIEDNLASTLIDEGMPTLIRGIRGPQDLDHEMIQNKFVKEMLHDKKDQFKSVFIPCDDEFRMVSSSALRAVGQYDAHVLRRYTVC